MGKLGVVPQSRSYPEAGFTLVEVLVTASLLGMLAFTSGQLIVNSTTQNKRVEQKFTSLDFVSLASQTLSTPGSCPNIRGAGGVQHPTLAILPPGSTPITEIRNGAPGGGTPIVSVGDTLNGVTVTKMDLVSHDKSWHPNDPGFALMDLKLTLQAILPGSGKNFTSERNIPLGVLLQATAPNPTALRDCYLSSGTGAGGAGATNFFWEPNPDTTVGGILNRLTSTATNGMVSLLNGLRVPGESQFLQSVTIGSMGPASPPQTSKASFIHGERNTIEPADFGTMNYPFIQGTLNTIRSATRDPVIMGLANFLNAPGSEAFIVGVANTVEHGFTIGTGGRSFVFGAANKVLTQDAYAFGFKNTIRPFGTSYYPNGGRYSLALGTLNLVERDKSVAVGVGNRAIANTSFALGNTANTGTLDHSFAISSGVRRTAFTGTCPVADDNSYGAGQTYDPDCFGALKPLPLASYQFAARFPNGFLLSTDEGLTNTPLNMRVTAQIRGQSFAAAGGNLGAGDGYNATVPAGAVAMGVGANAIHAHSLALGENAQTAVANQMVARFTGGYQLYSGSGMIGAQLSANDSSWTSLSDRNSKTSIQDLDPAWVAHQISKLPIYTWIYKNQPDKSVRHVGPMAQDFHKLFGRDLSLNGQDNKTINQGDLMGITLVGVKAVIHENEALKAKVADLEARLERLEKALSLTQSKTK